MQDLVFVNDSGGPVTRTTAIAQGAKHKNATVIRLVRALTQRLWAEAYAEEVA